MAVSVKAAKLSKVIDVDGSEVLGALKITGKNALKLRGEEVTVPAGKGRLRLTGVSGPTGFTVRTISFVPEGQEDFEQYDRVVQAFNDLLASESPITLLKRLTGDVSRQSKKSRRGSHSENSNSEGASPEQVRRWAKRKEALLRENDHATGPELGRLLGSRAKNLSERASSWRRAGRLFAVNNGSQDVYPLFQLKDDKPRLVVAKVLQVLRQGNMSDWEIFAWFSAPDTWVCKGRAPKDLLDADPDAVIEAARHAVAEQVD